ncbi:MAG: YicC family protein [Nitrospinae bacterium]|nr:YicC family protein [Nitrospinota bacterium]
MIRSMTGYGYSEQVEDDNRCIIEVRSVNNRYLDISFRFIKKGGQLDQKVRRRIKERFSRGSFDISITFDRIEEGNGLDVRINRNLAKRYIEAAQELKSELKIGGEIDINSILRLKDVIIYEESQEDIGLYSNILDRTLDKALESLKLMREEEGRVLLDDMLLRLRSIKESIVKIKDRQPVILKEYTKRLKERVESLLGGTEADMISISQEIAILAERCDVTEEIVRLESHIEQFILLTKGDGPVGRKLEFILQEMNREANTIGAKTNDYPTSQAVIEIKSELEKIREQAQNVE